VDFDETWLDGRLEVTWYWVPITSGKDPKGAKFLIENSIQATGAAEEQHLAQ